MRFQPRTSLALVSLLACSVLSACQPDYSALDIDVVSTPIIPVDIRSTSVEIPVGVAVLVRAIPRSGNATGYHEVSDCDDVAVRQQIVEGISVTLDLSNEHRTFPARVQLSGRTVRVRHKNMITDSKSTTP